MQSDKYSRLRRAANRRTDSLWRSMKPARREESSVVAIIGAPLGPPMVGGQAIASQPSNNDGESTTRD